MGHKMNKSAQQETKLEYVSPEELEFNPDNPRFGGEVAGKSQDEIREYLFGEPHRAFELVESFLENGFIDYEPLVVARKGEKFIVIEGNRRLAAIKEIRAHPDQYKERTSDLNRIPVLVFPDSPGDQQENQMRVYLGVRHLLGFREWPPISKAQFLEQESKKEGGIDRVIKEIRVTKQEVRRFLIPYRLIKSSGAGLPPREDFWVLGEALGRTGVKKYIQLEVNPTTLDVENFDKQNFKLLLDHLYGPKKPGTKERDVTAKVVNDTRDLSRLARVLSSERATSVLYRTKSLDQAEIHVDTLEESLRRLQKLTKDVTVVVKKLVPQVKDHESTALQQILKQFDFAVKAFVRKRTNRA